MKIGFIGCVESSQVALEALLASEATDYQVVGVITKKSSPFNTDFVDLSYLCTDQSIPCFYHDKYSNDAAEQFMRDIQPDVIFCIGWSYLLKNEFLEIAEHGVIGFHPAKLPSNRGRHPIIWALALGLEETASTFFKMDQNADSGPIVSQIEIKIRPDSSARCLYAEILKAVSYQVLEIADELATGSIKYSIQDHSESNLWRKRTSRDGIIDFRMSAEDIHNLVLALSEPYPGAAVIFEDQQYSVWKSALCFEEYPRNIEPGRVLGVENDVILLKVAGTSAIYLWQKDLSEQLTEGGYL